MIEIFAFLSMGLFHVLAEISQIPGGPETVGLSGIVAALTYAGKHLKGINDSFVLMRHDVTEIKEDLKEHIGDDDRRFEEQGRRLESIDSHLRDSAKERHTNEE